MKKRLFPLESTENESKDVLVRVTITGDKVSRYQDVVSELCRQRPYSSLAVLLVYDDGASLPDWHLASTSL